MATGYSKRSLIEKLGIKEGSTIQLINTPDNYIDFLGILPPKVINYKITQPNTDLIHYFVKSRKNLERAFPRLKRHIKPSGILWISWPKGTSGLRTDLNENIVREIGLEHGLVDAKVIAVDNIWSALKFVYRIADR